MDSNYLFILVLALIESQDLLSLAFSLLSTKQKCIVVGLYAILLIIAPLPKEEVIETKPRVFLTAETSCKHYEAEVSFQVLKQAKPQSVMPVC